jgi:hypothetical protein
MHRVQPKGRDYLLCYLLFAVLLALCYFTFVAWQQAITLVVGVVLDRSEGTQAVLGLGAVFVGMALFGFVMGAEPYLRGGVERGLLRARFLRLLLPLLGALLVGEAVRQGMDLYIQVLCKLWGTC